MVGGSSAYAQLTGLNSVICNTAPTNNPTIRAEGLAEQVGDFIIVCTGGTPTPFGQPIPQVAISLQLNANITSRLLGGGYIDALLTIDEPFPATGTAHQAPFAIYQPAGSPTGQNVCFSNSVGSLSSPANCNALNGTFNSGPGNIAPGGTQGNFSGSPYDPSNPIASAQDPGGVSNVFVAHQVSGSQVVWYGVPIDAPGTAGTRVLRMTNIRANASLVPPSTSLLPYSIVGFLSILTPSNVTIGGNGEWTLAYVEPGLIAGSGSARVAQRINFFDAGFLGAAATGQAVSSITVTEGFPNAFKPRALISGPVNDVSNNNTDALAQNITGASYNTESGLQPPAPSNLPADVTAPTGAGAQLFGGVNAGTRFLIVFNNAAGMSIFLPQYVPLAGGAPLVSNGPLFAAPSYTGGWLQLVGSSDLYGNIDLLAVETAAFGPASAPFIAANFSSPANPFSAGTVAPWLGAVKIPVSPGGVAAAVYEVANSDPYAIETANIPIGIAYSATSFTSPAAGQVTTATSFAPLSAGNNIADETSPIPRFFNDAIAIGTGVLPGDVNGDGLIDCADVDIVKASFGKLLGQIGFDPRADVNGDGVVNVIDLAFVTRQFPPGTVCQ
jgi:hypothetical protein